MAGIRPPLAIGRLHTEHTPALAVPLLFMATGILAIISGFVRLLTPFQLLLYGNVSSFHTIATVHLFTLAGFTMAMMGALYQLVPVLHNEKPVSYRMALMQWMVYSMAAVLFVGAMNAMWRQGIILGGILLAWGIGWHLINLYLTLQRRQWNIPMIFIATALWYLAITVIMGLVLAIHLSTGAFSIWHGLVIHLCLGLGGWFGFLVMGVSYRLWAMFAASRQTPKFWLATWLLQQSAVILGVLSVLTEQTRLFDWGWTMAVVGGIMYLADLIRLKAFSRRTLYDPALATVALGAGSLLIWWILGTMALLGYPTLWVAALWVYMIGWVGFTLLGFSQKIVPFLIWLHRYAHVHGQGKVPRLTDIWRTSWSTITLMLGVAGLVLSSVGLVWGMREFWAGGLFMLIGTFGSLGLFGGRAVFGTARTLSNNRESR